MNTFCLLINRVPPFRAGKVKSCYGLNETFTLISRSGDIGMQPTCLGGKPTGFVMRSKFLDAHRRLGVVTQYASKSF